MSAGVASRERHVLQGLLVNREESDGRPVLGSHVGDCRSIGNGHVGKGRPEELHELPHDTVLAQQLGDSQHEVGGGGSVGKAAGEAEADDLRQEQIDRLAHHHRLGLDTADTPADDTEPVDHRGVAVGADERIRKKHAVLVPDHPGEVLEVDLVNDAGRRRDHPEVVESGLAPLQELIAFPVALELHLAVDLKGQSRVEGVDLHRVIDHQIGLDLRIDLGGGAGVTGHVHDRGSHRGEVDDGRYAGEVLEHDPGRLVDNLGLAHLGGVVLGNGAHVFVGEDPGRRGSAAPTRGAPLML